MQDMRLIQNGVELKGSMKVYLMMVLEGFQHSENAICVIWPLKEGQKWTHEVLMEMRLQVTHVKNE